MKPIPNKKILRRDHDDSNMFHVIIERPAVTRYSSAVRWHVCSLHEDMLVELFGARIAELAEDLSRGEQMPLEVTASCPDDNEEVEAA